MTSGMEPNTICHVVSESTSTVWRRCMSLTTSAAAAHESPPSTVSTPAERVGERPRPHHEHEAGERQATASHCTPRSRSPRNSHASSSSQNGMV